MHIKMKGKSPKELYKLLSGAIVPRPIALVSTKDEKGIPNVAPYSYFTIVSSNPPIIMLSIGDRISKKDTLRNIENNQEFVVNLVDKKLVQSVHDSAAIFRPEINEFEEVGLTPKPTKNINSIAVKESLIHMECVLYQMTEVGDCFMVLGKVVNLYIDDNIYLGDYKVDFKKFNPLFRFAGKEYGTTTKYVSLERNINSKKLIKGSNKFLD